MDKAWIIRIGLVFLILSFFIGFFWPILFTPTAEKQGVTPSPSVLPAFTASDNTTATVKKLENRMILFCKEGKEELFNRLKPEFEGIPGVERVIVGGTVFDVSLSANASNQSVGLVNTLFSVNCPTGFAYRRALELDFHSTVNFTPPAGFDPIVARLPSALCKQPNWSCLVLGSTQENDTISVVVTLTRKADGNEEGVVQQVPIETGNPPENRTANSS